ncbi:hypothetical protein Celaphus_00015840, partial [Cervus elaphus hippelaphus]
MAWGPITLRDVVIEFFPHQWEFLNPLQKKLYCSVMMENYSNLVSIGHFISKPDIIVLLEERRDPWMVVREETRSWNTDPKVKIQSNQGTQQVMTNWQFLYVGESPAPLSLRLVKQK